MSFWKKILFVCFASLGFVFFSCESQPCLLGGGLLLRTCKGKEIQITTDTGTPFTIEKSELPD